MMIEKIKLDQIQELCKSNKVKTLYVFGSFLREDYRKDSDVDIDEKDPFKYTDIYFNLKSKLEEILQHQVDLLEERAIKNIFFRQELELTKVKIYGY